MTLRPWIAAFVFAAALARAADTAKVEITVQGVPANATEVVVVLDAGAAPAAGYDEPAAAAPVAVAAAPVAIDPAQPPPAQPQRRRRANAAPALPPPTRAAVATQGSTTATLAASVPVGENYQARVVALGGEGAFPTVLAGGRVSALKFAASDALPLQVSLKAPELKLAPDAPTTVTPGARYTLAGTITDAAHALGTKNRMRVWISEGTPPAANFAGTQTSTIDVTTNGDDVAFSFELTAPNRATTLYFQIGELPSDFARSDGRQAAFVVLPDLSHGAKPLSLSVK